MKFPEPAMSWYPNQLERVRVGGRVTIEPWQRALHLRRGEVIGVLGPGSFRVWSSGTSIRRIDTRAWVVIVPIQEIPTADSVTVKVSAVGRARIVDPAAAVLQQQDLNGALHVAIQQAVREVVGASTVDQVVSERAALCPPLAVAIRGIDEIGVELTDIELRDVVLPADLKRAQAQVLLARAEGQAALERARGETAALRALANAARLTADNPALYQLRVLQELGHSEGHSVVISPSG
jgi:regulator of protease activity HflC (stomatin/prohibitin superfamily)